MAGTEPHGYGCKNSIFPGGTEGKPDVFGNICAVSPGKGVEELEIPTAVEVFRCRKPEAIGPRTKARIGPLTSDL